MLHDWHQELNSAGWKTAKYSKNGSGTQNPVILKDTLGVGRQGYAQFVSTRLMTITDNLHGYNQSISPAKLIRFDANWQSAPNDGRLVMPLVYTISLTSTSSPLRHYFYCIPPCRLFRYNRRHKSGLSFCLVMSSSRRELVHVKKGAGACQENHTPAAWPAFHG